ncbi:MAG: CDP-alcohol phosphatidyltransferase family protein [Novosphingobium sp.]|nr:CDP-alcohol phosphatidyltransferase family protein [Novosphingobium sp.]
MADGEHSGGERPDGAKVRRVQANLLAAQERRLLTWLCGRMPGWVKPDHLTALGLVGALMVLGGYAFSTVHENWLWVCVAGYVVNWFGDSMDGSLARFRCVERPRYGYFLDHSCDAIATVLILLGIGASPYVALALAMVAMAGYLLMSIHAFLAVKAFGELRLSYLAAGPTELRLILIGLTLAMLVFGDHSRDRPTFTGFDYFVGGAGTLLIALFLVQTFRVGRELSGIDPKA